MRQLCNYVKKNVRTAPILDATLAMRHYSPSDPRPFLNRPYDPKRILIPESLTRVTQTRPARHLQDNPINGPDLSFHQSNGLGRPTAGTNGLFIRCCWSLKAGACLAMEMASISSSPRTVEEIFKDYSARRAGIVRALTYDVDEFYALCDPDKENLCLYGHPNESWEVNLPAEEVPPELPEPALGINFARDGMARRDWLSLVAMHSDSWLLSVAFYLAAPFNRNERKRLFSLINDLPAVFEVVTERKLVKDKPSADSGSKSRLATKRSSDGQAKSTPRIADEGYGEDEDEHSETLCGTCGGNYNANEFWICCDVCERWFHGKCVKITPAKAESIRQYKCPSCSNLKRGRQ